MPVIEVEALNLLIQKQCCLFGRLRDDTFSNRNGIKS